MERNGMAQSDLTGKTALIVGSTAGIGLRIAEVLALRGARIALNGRDPAAGRAAMEKFAVARTELVFEEGDAARYDEIARVVRRVEERFGAIDILVCSGGTDTPGPTLFQDLSPDLFPRAFEARFLPKVYPVHAALPGMRERQRGSVVLVTTDGGRQATPGQVLNGSIGAATILATKAMALEFARWKIRVNALALTLTSDTPLFEERLGNQDLGSRVFSKAIAKFPFGTPPSAREVATVAAFLASDEAAQVTGQTISVNGGLSFGGW